MLQVSLTGEKLFFSTLPLPTPVEINEKLMMMSRANKAGHLSFCPMALHCKCFSFVFQDCFVSLYWCQSELGLHYYVRRG